MIFLKEENGWVFCECEVCKKVMKFRRNLLVKKPELQMYKLPEAVECFCENESDRIIEVFENDVQSVNVMNRNISNTRCIPKCPTCNSDNVEKISLGSKAIGGVMFGILSSNVRKSYRCKNCGYRW